jgi:hypothetical protein
MRNALVLLAAVMIAGCAANQPMIYDKPGTTQAEFDHDQRTCKYDAMKSTQTTDTSYRTLFGQELDRAMRQRDLMIACMESKGYALRR